PVKPLPKRKNYVLTCNEDFEVKGRTKVLNSIDEVIELGKKSDVYIIGGGEIYHQLIPYADKLYLTHVHTVDFRATTFFPEVHPKEWAVSNLVKVEADKKHEFAFTFAE